jgi:hypothetical protein
VRVGALSSLLHVSQTMIASNAWKWGVNGTVRRIQEALCLRAVRSLSAMPIILGASREYWKCNNEIEESLSQAPQKYPTACWSKSRRLKVQHESGSDSRRNGLAQVG